MENYWVAVKTDYDENEHKTISIFHICCCVTCVLCVCVCHYATLFTPSNRNPTLYRLIYFLKWFHALAIWQLNLISEWNENKSSYKTTWIIFFLKLKPKVLSYSKAKCSQIPSLPIFYFGNLKDRVTSKHHSYFAHVRKIGGGRGDGGGGVEAKDRVWFKHV